jgi:hypothetical protein
MRGISGLACLAVLTYLTASEAVTCVDIDKDKVKWCADVVGMPAQVPSTIDQNERDRTAKQNSLGGSSSLGGAFCPTFFATTVGRHHPASCCAPG